MADGERTVHSTVRPLRMRAGAVPHLHQHTDLQSAALSHDELVNERAVPTAHGLFLLDERRRTPVFVLGREGSTVT